MTLYIVHPNPNLPIVYVHRLLFVDIISVLRAIARSKSRATAWLNGLYRVASNLQY